jgi:hypothetical protein|tara:strand:- start:1117 stop:1725 length:609 start_codon:yes stop_codon:yes gene_type:complete
MSAHLTDQDCINALATFWYEYHKQPRNEAPEQALERAYVIAPEQESIKTDYFERMEDFRLRASNQIEAYKPEYKSLAPCAVIFNILLRENERSLRALYPDDYQDMISSNYEFKKSSTVSKWLSERDPRGLMMIWQMLQGWEYQSCEHYEFRNSVAYQIKQQIEYGILNTLKKIHCPDDKDRVWTSWEDPQLDSNVVCISDMF